MFTIKVQKSKKLITVLQDQSGDYRYKKDCAISNEYILINGSLVALQNKIA